MNTRRDFIRSGAMLAPALVGFGLVANATPPVVESIQGIKGYLYKDYDIYWTGWKFSQYDMSYVSQWIAWPSIMGKTGRVYASPDDPRPCLFSSVPGRFGEFSSGMRFDVSSRKDQVSIDHTTSKEVKDRELAWGEKILLAMVDEVTSGVGLGLSYKDAGRTPYGLLA